MLRQQLFAGAWRATLHGQPHPTTPRAHPQHKVSAAQPRDMKPSSLPSLLLLLLPPPTGHAVPIARRELQDSEAEQSGSWSASSWDDSELADDPTYEPDDPEPETEPTCTSGPFDDPSWDVGFGPCCTYGRPGANAYHCVSDGACDSCGSSCADECMEPEESGSGWSATLDIWYPVRVRIAGGGSSGVLEMAVDGGPWDAVCNDGFGGAEATAVCLTMGFVGGIAFDTTHGDSSFAHDIHCPSGATGLSQCTLGNSPYRDNCAGSETVGITCWVDREQQDTGFSCYGEANGDPAVCVEKVRSFRYYSSASDDDAGGYYSSGACEDYEGACVAVTAAECREQRCMAPPAPPMPVAPFPGYPLHPVSSYGGWEMFCFFCFLLAMTCCIPCGVGFKLVAMRASIAAPKTLPQSSTKRATMRHASSVSCLAVLWVVQIIWVHRAPWTLLCCLVIAENMAAIALCRFVSSVEESLLQGATMDTVTQRRRWEQLGFFGMMAALLLIAMVEYGPGYYAWLVRLMLSVGAMAGKGAEAECLAYVVAWAGAVSLSWPIYWKIRAGLGYVIKGATDAANQLALVVVFVALAYLWSPAGVHYVSYFCSLSLLGGIYMLCRLCGTLIQGCKNRCKTTQTHPVGSGATAAAPAVAATAALPVPHADTKLQELPTDSAEYVMVAARLAETLPKARLVRVSHVVNPAVSAFVDMNRRRLLAELSPTPTCSTTVDEGEFERYLWHGTRGIHPQIIWADRQDGFMTQKSKQGMWGTGTYFAENAIYSARYAHNTTTNTKQMFLAKVVVGTCVEMPPTNTLRHPPQRTDDSNMRYNTVCGQTGGNKVFVVYEGGRAFPEFLVEYSDTKQYPRGTPTQTGVLQP